MLAARSATGTDTATPAGASTPRTLEEIQAELAKLPGPVSRIGEPAAAPAVRSTPPAATSVVRPDPLRPRVINAQPAPKHVPTYAREPVNTMPIAGTSRSKTPPKPEPIADADSAMAPGVVAADSLDRIVAREPVYPVEALRNGTKGWVELEFTVTPNGSVRDIEVVAAEPRGVFDSAASEAVAGWRFRPRVVNGQPVAQRSTVTMRFDIDG
jgi:protein TonB